MVSAHFPVRLPKLFLVGMMGVVAACAPTNSSTPMPETPATAAMQDAAQTPGAESENPAAGTGPTQIVIYRGAGAIGLLATAKPKVKVDGTPVGQCRRKDKIVVPVSPGTYQLAMRTDIAARTTVTVQEGQTIYVRCTLLPIGVLLPAPALKQVDAVTALKRVSAIPVQPSL